jgi:Protein of unknown function (DUF2958)
MQLLTPELREKLPKLYSQEKEPDAGCFADTARVAHVKFFNPCGSWTWYATEFDGEDTFFGLVSGLDEELGYFSLSELQAYRGASGLGIERDLHFQPTPLSQLRNR